MFAGFKSRCIFASDLNTNTMTNAQLIGKETMLARLIDFHSKRFNRNGMSWKKDEYLNWLKSLSTRKLSKEYDATFAEVETNYTADFTGTSLDTTTEAEKEFRMKEIMSQPFSKAALMG